MARFDLTATLMGVTFAAIWASAFTSARIIVADAPALGALALRFWVSGAIGIALAYLLGERIRLTRAQWTATITFGLAQNGAYLGLNFVAMRTIEASLATIVAAALPLLVAIAGLVRGERLRPVAILGLILGFAGVALVMGTRLSAGVDPFGLALAALGLAALTLATLMVAGAMSGGNVLMIVGLQMWIAAAVLTPVSLATEAWVFAPDPRWWAAFAYTILMPGLVATYVWFRLVGRIGATRAAVFHFLTPPFGVAIAWWLLGEDLGETDVIGVGIVAAGILMVQLARRPA